MRRLTRREQLKNQISSLDTFPKVIPEYKEDVMKTSSSGGLSTSRRRRSRSARPAIETRINRAVRSSPAATILATLLIAFLVGSELLYYRTVGGPGLWSAHAPQIDVKYEYRVDPVVDMCVSASHHTPSHAQGHESDRRHHRADELPACVRDGPNRR